MAEMQSEVTWLNKEEKEEKEEVEAQVEIWKYIFGFVELSVVKCAIQLGIADAIEKYKKPISLLELSSTLKCDPSYLNRIMRFLVHRKIFKTISTNHDNYPSYVQTPLSRRLIQNGKQSMTAFLLLESSHVMVAPWLSLSDRVLVNGNPSFQKVHGEDLWGYTAKNLDHSNLFNDAMACDAKVIVPAIIEGYSELFDGVKSMVDVGGGNGTTLSILVKDFPWIQGINFDLAHVIDVAPKYDGIQHMAGDMFTSVPKADAVFLKASSFLPSAITENDYNFELPDSVQTGTLRSDYTSITVDNTLSLAHSLVQITCQDHKGLLYDIMRILKDYNIKISFGRFTTKPQRKCEMDLFIMQADGKKIVDPNKQSSLLSRLRTELYRPLRVAVVSRGLDTELLVANPVELSGEGRPLVFYDITLALKMLEICIFSAEIGRNSIRDREWEVYRILLDEGEGLSVPRNKIEEGVWKMLMGWE
ncbi:hypothetical protein RYX36_015051 [Vicia faba]